MKTVFIVIGSQGEYSDHSMWHVNAYLDKTLAEAEAAALNGFFDLLTRSRRRGYRSITASTRTGICTSWRRSWSIWTISSSSGASAT